MIFLVLILLLFSILFYKNIIKPYYKFKESNVPCIKFQIPFGIITDFIFRRKSFAQIIQDTYNACNARYFRTFIFTSPAVAIKDVNLLKQLTIKDFEYFVDHRVNGSIENDPIFSRNLFALKGQEWKQMRSILSPAFTGSKMRSMFVLMSECAENFTKYFETTLNSKEPLTIDVKDIFTRFANDIIASTAFGIQINSLVDRDNQFYLMGKELSEFKGKKLLKFFGYIICPTLMKYLGAELVEKKTANYFHKIIQQNIEMREKQGVVRPDLIHLLLEARKGKLKHDNNKDTDTGFATVDESQYGKEVENSIELTDEVITSQAMLFFTAGFETMSIVLCHAVYELAQHEEIQKRLQKEIDDTLAECNGKLTYDALMKMKYLDQVVTETLRKWPPTPGMDRVCTNYYTIKPESADEVPHLMKPDDTVLIPIYGVHRDPKYYPNPDKFDPDRFSDENKENIIPYTFIPFGIGPRSCIASRFALLEAKVVLFYTLSKLDYVIVEKSDIPLQINCDQINMNSKNGFWLGLKLRNS